MASNYEKMVEGARRLFLGYDQAAMIDRWGLDHDADDLFVTWLGERLAIDRRTARVRPVRPERCVPSDYIDESMALFDLLTLSPTRPRAVGRWASISALGGIIGAGHDRTLSHEATAARFAGRQDALRAACGRLGGAPMGRADVGYAIPVFEDFAVWFQFWDGDDEFPASVKYLFDENALRFMHYETLWYVMNNVAARLDYFVNGEGRA